MNVESYKMGIETLKFKLGWTYPQFQFFGIFFVILSTIPNQSIEDTTSVISYDGGLNLAINSIIAYHRRDRSHFEDTVGGDLVTKHKAGK